MSSTHSTSPATPRLQLVLPVFPPAPSALHRPPSSKRPPLPTEIWLSIVRYMFEAGDFVALASFATTGKPYNAMAQPFLYRDVVFRRSNNRNRKRMDIENRKATLMELLLRHPSLLTYIRSISIYSSSRDTWWITNPSMRRLLHHLYSYGSLTGLSVVGIGSKGLDGRLFHIALFASLPPTIHSLTLSNIRFLSPRVFYALSHVSMLYFANVFCHATGCRSIARLLQTFPPAPLGLRPSLQLLEYSRQTAHADTYYGMPCEVLGQYVQFGNLTEAKFRTDHADDYSLLFSVLQQTATSLRILTLDVTGVTIDRYFRRYPPAAQFPPLVQLTRLTLAVTYSSEHPIRAHPWQGLVFTLNALSTPRLEHLTVRLVYKGYWKGDFMHLLAASDDWQSLDSALRALLCIFPKLTMTLDFVNFVRSHDMLWGQGEHGQASFIQQTLQSTRNVGPLQYGVLTHNQIARMLPALFSFPSASTRITFSWA